MPESDVENRFTTTKHSQRLPNASIYTDMDKIWYKFNN